MGAEAVQKRSPRLPPGEALSTDPCPGLRTLEQKRVCIFGMKSEVGGLTRRTL